jgi:hypothetical protein
MGAMNRVGKGLSYRADRLHRLTGRCDNSVPAWFLASIDCSKIPPQEQKKEGFEQGCGCRFFSMRIGIQIPTPTGTIILIVDPVSVVPPLQEKVLNFFLMKEFVTYFISWSGRTN